MNLNIITLSDILKLFGYEKLPIDIDSIVILGL
jgi:hypothetical protein